MRWMCMNQGRDSVSRVYWRFRFFLLAASIVPLPVTASLRAQQPSVDSLPLIAVNDNRHPAGVLGNTGLQLSLEARTGMWYPDGPSGPGVAVAAFAEPGRPLQNPGPVIRVAQGTQVTVTLRNSLRTALTMHGLGSTRGVAHDTVRIESGAQHTFTFRTNSAGTFYYVGRTGKAGPLRRLLDDSQLHGAIVVDPPGREAARRAMRDRIFVMSIWGIVDPASPTGLRRGTMAINGRAWPHTERIDMAQGDTAHWRWVNLTELHHPMHLHGFYFRINTKGDGVVDTAYAPMHRRKAVTEVLAQGETMDISWSPNRAGNWLFHCHMAGHMSHEVSISTFMGVPVATQHTAESHGGHAAGAPAHAMAGLVLGIRVTQSRKTEPVTPVRRRERAVRLWIQSKPGVFGGHDGYAYTVGQPLDSTAGARFGMSGPALVL